MTSVAVSVENLKKEYRLGVLNHGMLAHDLRDRFARWRNRSNRPSPVIEPEIIPPDTPRFRRGRFYALDDVSVEIQQGQSIGIIGENGAGKSTFLKILSRITMPSSGRVRMRGRLGSL